MDSTLDKWLEQVNQQFGAEDIPYIRRPFEAMSKLGLDYGISITIPSSFSDDLFRWFEEHAPAGAHHIGSMFTGVFYYDAYFWRVEIPISYGMHVELNALDALEQMPVHTRLQLQNDREMMYKYYELWIDLMDYAFGIDDLGCGSRLPPQANQDFAANLTASGHRELNATVRLLTQDREPSSKSWETARMATEMFMKAYLSVNTGIDEKTAQKKFGHDLKKLSKECLDVGGLIEFNDISQQITVFPDISARYQDSHYDNGQLWAAFAVALRTAVTFTRSLTDRENRHRLRGQSDVGRVPHP